MAKKASKHTAPQNKVNIFAKMLAGFKSLSKGKKILIISLISLLLVAVILVGVVLGVIADITKDYNHEEIVDPEIEEIEQIDEKITNIALFGIDSRSKGFSGLSDSIMILSLNENTGEIKLISIMRDSLVEMPDLNGKTYKPNKINAAYSRGGAAYAIKVLNQNYGLDIKEYATVNFYGMAEIIDAVGGVEIEVLQREIGSSYAIGELTGVNSCIYEQAYNLGIDPPYVTKPGLQTLSGIQAVAWARIRKVSTADGTANDYGRTDRQRVVMEKLLNKALSMSVTEYPALIKAMLPHMQTSLDFGEVLKLATNVLGKQVNFQQTRVPQQEYVISDNYCNYYAGAALYYDRAYAAKIIHAIIYDGITQEEYIEQNGIEQNKWYRNLVSGGSGSSNSNTTTNSTTTTPPSTNGTPSTPADSGSSEETPSSKEPSSQEPVSSQEEPTTPPSTEQGTEEPSSQDTTTTE